MDELLRFKEKPSGSRNGVLKKDVENTVDGAFKQRSLKENRNEMDIYTQNEKDTLEIYLFT